MEFVDTHCHLYFEQLKSKIDDVIENAKTAKVTRMICAGTSIADSAEAARIAASYEGVWAAVGVHPHEAAGFLDNKDSVLRFNEIISNPKVVAAGEMGLDYYKSETPRRRSKRRCRLINLLSSMSATPGRTSGGSMMSMPDCRE
jgi:TatD DNase family protein